MARERTIDARVKPGLMSRIGTVYRGGQGQWSWALHRISGVGVALFLFVHILDTSLVVVGEEAYNRVVGAYKTPVVLLLEMGLATMVLFHALNGLRIILIDFFPRLADHHRRLFGIVMGLYVVLVVPAMFFMGRHFIEELTGGH